MTKAINAVRDSFSRRFAYRRTHQALMSLPLRTRIDCDIAGREAETARIAVYGQ
ncbi:MULTISPECIES: glyceraldehyde-3-phosphate dehydrogenase [Roseobacteraceae]|uniref:glyceraldehyde-3-phosphate dehydrogenase n=1 Tax=Roseobacteraceae TaxID=2854170 RepID=UPI00080AC296|nr:MULTISPECIES: glyceraldehyde-3-phosphate dehydrogenase [Roseobacteraceae]ANT59137.1 glyceraldehyde-3-phosphate dehydrogenase [Salipiger sp. CCB-MM3]MCA0996451.1 glyceraldehyde-3-phosphate dehydrogenase [Alloyangia pacifica]NDV98127.1 glyceraldehyde-3-phosphate dehydrogenase [Salipiger sp. PrR002]NDW57102.1 glyceraldehyde-3-phosphate dehydrogenase [Salipiger sp. PrR004]